MQKRAIKDGQAEMKFQLTATKEEIVTEFTSTKETQEKMGTGLVEVKTNQKEARNKIITTVQQLKTKMDDIKENQSIVKESRLDLRLSRSRRQFNLDFENGRRIKDNTKIYVCDRNWKNKVKPLLYDGQVSFETYKMQFEAGVPPTLKRGMF